MYVYIGFKKGTQVTYIVVIFVRHFAYSTAYTNTSIVNQYHMRLPQTSAVHRYFFTDKRFQFSFGHHQTRPHSIFHLCNIRLVLPHFNVAHPQPYYRQVVVVLQSRFHLVNAIKGYSVYASLANCWFVCSEQ